MRDNDRLIDEYEMLVTNLLAWIQKMTEELKDRSFPNTITGVQALVTDFNQFRTVEKPPKWVYEDCFSPENQVYLSVLGVTM